MNNDNQPLVPETPAEPAPAPAEPAASDKPTPAAESTIPVASIQDNGSLIQDTPAPAADTAPKEKPKMKTGKKIIIIVCALLFVAAIVVGVVLLLINAEKERQNALQKDAESFIGIVRDAKENISIYTFEEYGSKANLDKSPYGNEYTKESYVTNYNDHIYVCLYDGGHRIKGYADHLAIDEDGECKYEFVDHAKIAEDEYEFDEKKAYLKNYTRQQYGYLEPSFEEKDGKIQVNNNYFTYEIDVKFENNKAAVTSNFEEKENEFYKTASLLNIVTYYTKVYYKTGSLKDKNINSIFQLSSVNYPYVRIWSYFDYKQAESFMDEFYKFAQEHKFEMVGKVIDIIALNNNNKFAYDIAFGQKKSTGEWAIYKENNEE